MNLLFKQLSNTKCFKDIEEHEVEKIVDPGQIRDTQYFLVLAQNLAASRHARIKDRPRIVHHIIRLGSNSLSNPALVGYEPCTFSITTYA